MAAVNPFTYGNPISDSKRFVGRRREVKQVYMRLRNAEFESSSIVGERRSGKTSLLNYIAHSDTVQAYGLDPESYLFVYLDLEMINATSTPTRLYQHMLRRIASRVENEDLKKEIRDVSQYESIDTYDLAEALDSMEDRDLSVVLLIDEFENLGNNANFGPDFYYGLRSLAIHHDLALVTSTRVDLVEISHSEEVRSSPFFNIFATINLQPFSRDDIAEMLDTYLADSGISFPEPEMDQLLALSGRVPFFAQMALHFLFEAHDQVEDESRRVYYVEQRVKEAAAPHLENYWQNSSENERTVLALLAILENESQGPLKYWQPADLEGWYIHAGVGLGKLVNRGLAVRQDEGYALGSTTILRWIAGELTAANSDMESQEERQRLESMITASLPQKEAAPALQWLSKTNTRYRELFARWLSDPRTSNRILELLTSSRLPFQELMGETGARDGGVAADRVLEALSTVTEAERNRANQMASMEGTVSILFTDLEGSTELLTRLGDEENQELLMVHNGIIREQVDSHGGFEVKAMGDGFMVVFSSTRKAVACAMDIQRSLSKYNQRQADRQLKVRMGINVGETIKEGEDFFGTAVVLAARVMDQAAGEQILVSDLFRKLAGSSSGLQFVDHGLKPLKGFTEEERVHEVVWRDNPG